MVAAGIAIAVSGATGTGKTTLLNILERHLFLSHEHQSATALPTTNLQHNTVQVAANDGDIGVVGAAGGLADLQGPLEVGTAPARGRVDMCEPSRLLNSFGREPGRSS
jgi:hypothetical protein